MKISSLIIILSTICLVSGIFWIKKDNRCIVSTSSGDWVFEIARTHDEHMLGLMHRTGLCERCGMLFVFQSQRPQVFWMKNTYIPLDMYFYDATGSLVDVAKNMRPTTETPEPMTYHSEPAQYVVEVVAGADWGGNTISACL